MKTGRKEDKAYESHVINSLREMDRLMDAANEVREFIAQQRAQVIRHLKQIIPPEKRGMILINPSGKKRKTAKKAATKKGSGLIGRGKRH